MFKPSNHLPNISALFRKNFFTGVLVITPLAVSGWIVGSMLRTIWQLPKLLPASWQPNYLFPGSPLAFLFNLAITIGGTLVLILTISFLGWASKQLLGRKVLHLLEVLIQRIPVIRSIYSALDQLFKTMAAGGDGQQFSRVVYIEYPRRGVWALAFVTGTAKGPAAPAGHLNVYVPTTPNPTSGFHLIIPEIDVRESHLKVEDAFKTILSLGIAQPDGK